MRRHGSRRPVGDPAPTGMPPAAPSAGTPSAGGEVDGGAGHAEGIRLLRRPAAALRTRRHRTLAVSGVAGFGLLVASLALPVPYVAQQPGPTLDTLGDFEGTPMVSVEGAPTYPTEGELRMTTVAVLGGPGYRMNAGAMVASWFDPDSVVVPLEQYYPPRVSQEQIQERASMEMQTSQIDAAVAALDEVGHTVPTTLTVRGVSPGSGAEGSVREGDVLSAITVAGERTEISDYGVLMDVLTATPPGTEITLSMLRDGAPVDATFVTGSRHERDAAAGLPVGEEPDGSVLGLALEPDAELPVDVEYQIDDVGGPSAGMMFALATVDKLTPGAMTGGLHVAGTGTIGLDGSVGPIGGIRQKVLGARDDGAAVFLAPQANCPELAGHVPEGLAVHPVGTLHQARTTVETVASGDAEAIAALPTCG